MKFIEVFWMLKDWLGILVLNWMLIFLFGVICNKSVLGFGFELGNSGSCGGCWNLIVILVMCCGSCLLVCM